MSPRITEMQGRDYDVVVVGAGINGSSAARELAAAGYSVLLVDRSDFAAGASSRSSRILHCGLRYFETPNPIRTFAFHPQRFAAALRMARAGMEARTELVGRSPQRCKPFTMCFPIYPESPVRGWHLDLGFRILRRLGPPEPALAYRRLKSDFETHLPFANDLRDPESLRSIATYREYIMDWPDRLCVDAALDAERNGAEIRLFCEASVIRRKPEGWLVELRDGKGEAAEVRASVVLNMAGTWVDAVNANPVAGKPAPCLVRGTKGAHIAVRLPDSYRGYGIATINRSGMPFYCLPSHDDCFYFGPTETPFDGDAAGAAATNEDIDFLLAEANHMLPGLRLGRRHVEFTWAGVRPLTFDAAEPMGRRTRQIHDLASAGRPGIFAMTAGPVMSHLSAGREMLRVVEKQLKPTRRLVAKRTFETRDTGAESAISRPLAQGRRAAFRTAVSVEHARDLKGILYTRTGLAWRRHLDRAEVEEAADAISDLVGWAPERTVSEIDGFIRYQKTAFRAASDHPSQPTTHKMGDVEA
ncbi:FAD-dependent oxidoreductase [Mesorhizobium sp. B2-6-4]|uniref:FAD-dependent oxidoreductase n=1 Tax=Mesorhizobium sp. B2-6-4 TaxID=2589913 RepID=UPI00112AC808|nr:FAD-dependent oxidoreductase [Mesorhizobium sp. B2-6-4]TPJ52367.1 FAD-dependent oxidoreductase [Mesorhizobium sp. B2-6-4]